MESKQRDNKRLLRNTIYMYFRMLLMLGIGLYTSRVILATLGISDFGLYNVVGGVVSMFSFLNSALSTGTQRFLNYTLGIGNIKEVKTVFSTSLLIHVVLIAIVLIIGETIGLWFVTHQLNIALGRETAAFWIYQASLFTLCFQIIQLPFVACIVAHEKMSIYAYFSIAEALMKLGVVFMLTSFDVDKLILYGFLMLCVYVLTALFYIVYSKYSFEEVFFSCRYNHGVLKKMLSFSGWNLFGGFCSICNSQGVNIVINIFCGTVVNAARGISFQVNSMVCQFVTSFQIAVKPQIVKCFASKELDEMKNLMQTTAKLSAFLMTIVTVPLIVEIRFVLKCWLGTYPDYAPIFVILILIRSLFYSMTSATLMAIHACGYVKKVSIVSGLTYLAVLPIGYFILSIGGSPIMIFIVNIFACVIDQYVELSCLQRYLNFPIIQFYKDVYGKVLPIVVTALLSTFFIQYLLLPCSNSFRFISVIAWGISVSCLLIYKFGIDRQIQKMIRNKVSTSFLHR